MMKHIILLLFFIASFTVSMYGQKQNLSEFSPSKLKNMGKNALQLGDTYSAIDYFEAYCNQKKDYKIMFLLAECYRSARDYPKAKIWYEMAYKAKPTKNQLALFYFASMLKTEQKYEEASRHFKSFKKSYSGSANGIDYKRLASYQITACDTAKVIIDSALMVEINHLSTSINKASIEFAPQYMNDSVFLFSSLRSDTAVYTINDSENDKIPVRKFYYAQKKKEDWSYLGQWNEGEFNTENINSGNGVFSIDKKRFYFTRCEPNWKFQTICQIYVSKKNGKKWGTPELLPETINSKNFTSTQPAIGTESKKDEEVLYFVTNREGGKGGYDIWYSIYMVKKKEWREPKNCGNKINTPGDELTPFYDMKTRSLYFSSTGLPGLGELDIFRSLGELGKWNPAENVGYPINSPYDDLYFVLNKNGNEGFFTSNRIGSVSLTHPTCCDDIYSFKYVDFINLAVKGKVYEIVNKKIQAILQGKIEPTDVSVTNPTGLKYLEGSIVALYVINEKTKEKTFIKKDTTDNQGRYFFDIEVNKKYVVEFEGSQIPPKTVDLVTKGITKSDTLQIDDVGIEFMSKQPFVIKNIYYDFDKSKLTKEAQQIIDSTLLIILQEAPHIIIELSSHTDSKGEDLYNMDLSQKRAESVVAYLIKKGIDKNRLYAKGYGETKPIALNENPDGTDNPEGRQKNRRTEFRIIGTINQYSEIIYEE